MRKRNANVRAAKGIGDAAVDTVRIGVPAHASFFRRNRRLLFDIRSVDVKYTLAVASNNRSGIDAHSLKQPIGRHIRGADADQCNPYAVEVFLHNLQCVH